ncbi:MAG: HEAT repeat domain-containing protein [Chloroflexi bacterium]|nr:HEAT repeat domain-containing protein [Chloroflexota bacterium]
MVTREYVDDLKLIGTSEFCKLGKERNVAKVLSLLENLGRLPPQFEGDCLVPLLSNSDDRVRFLAAKNIGKLANDKYLELLSPVAKSDTASKVRREAVSAIGRMRSRKAIPFLIEMTDDIDPKVVMQVIRALLVFKHDADIQRVLKRLANHPNEVIQSVISNEFRGPKHNGTNSPKHTESPDHMKNVVVLGDVREVLRSVPDESIHLTFTSPPYYNARDYSIYRSYREYLEFLADVFREVHRVTKEGRFFLLNTSPIIIPRMSRQYSSKRYPIPFDIHPYLTDMGWEFIDDIVWIKPEASVKNRNAGFLQHRKPLAYKPNPVTEYVMVYRKKTEKLIDWSIRQYSWDTIQKSRVSGEYETTNTWRIDPVFDRVHSAVFPLELCIKVLEFYSYAGDVVFDPFAGSGTLGKAALKLNRFFFMTEKEWKYVALMRQEINTFQNVKPSPRFLDIGAFQSLGGGFDDVNGHCAAKRNPETD